MGTSIGRAIDYLVAGLKEPAEVVDPAAEVADNIAIDEASESLITIGREAFESNESGTGDNGYAALGNLRVRESYTIPGFAYAERRGPLQKPARDAALALFDVVVKFINDDPTLGGILENGRIATLTQVALQQTPAPDGSSAQMWAQVAFVIAVENTYIP